MFESLILNGIGTFFGEKSSVEIKKIGKELSTPEKVHIFNLFLIVVSLIVLSFTKNFQFEINMWFFTIFIIMMFGSVGFNYFVMKAIENADRSTNGLLSIIAIPLLLISDIVLGYDVNKYHIIGIIFIIVTLVFVSTRGTINLKGAQYTVITQFFSFINIMIFKYIITNYTSTEILNIMIGSTLYIGSFAIILSKNKSLNSVKKLYAKKYLKFGLLGGFGSIFNSMGYLFGPASIVTAIKRVFSMFWGVVMGKVYFKEERFYQKLGSVGFVSLGIVIMNFQIFIDNRALLTNIQTAKLLRGDVKGYTQDIKSDPDFGEKISEISRPEAMFSLY